MAPRTLLTILALTATVATPAMAQDGTRRRPNREGNQAQQGAGAPEQAERRERAVPRTVEPRRNDQTQRQDQTRREEQARQNDQSHRQYDAHRNDNNGRNDNNRRYDTRRYTPRIVRPSIVRVVPYRPYVYRPTYRGGYYGSGGYYVYGATPRGYYDPIPGRYYGGVRITGAPRDAEVFADGYYVGIVNDFDGIFQHLNLEAGAHRVEIAWDGYQPLAFDVFVQPGETTTFRADGYFRY